MPEKKFRQPGPGPRPYAPASPDSRQCQQLRATTRRHLTSSTTDLSRGSRTLGLGACHRSPYVPSENKERCTCLFPNQGSTGGGTLVTITGTNLPPRPR
ncbi:IPT/TIG domain-containing protein [Streptomyces sp. NPDC032161]|uniref:IPT/TIG domain-containing protein n=1 Tax=unclassified Streptomyces TaxID=2593676 RepID=UPI0033E838F8